MDRSRSEVSNGPAVSRILLRYSDAASDRKKAAWKRDNVETLITDAINLADSLEGMVPRAESTRIAQCERAISAGHHVGIFSHQSFNSQATPELIESGGTLRLLLCFSTYIAASAALNRVSLVVPSSG